MTKNNTLSYRVEQLEKNYDSLDKKLDHLLVNELPHLQEELTSLKTRVSVSTAINVGAIILLGFLIYLLRI